MHMRRRYGSLEEISAAVSSCTKCPLCKTRKMSVPGNGSYNAKIMFIGEAPGRSEDLRACIQASSKKESGTEGLHR